MASDRSISARESLDGQCDGTQVTGTQIGSNKRALDVVSRTGTLSGVLWDSFSVARPLDTQEVWSLFEGGLAGTLKATITLNYTDSSKCDLLNGEVLVL